MKRPANATVSPALAFGFVLHVGHITINPFEGLLFGHGNQLTGLVQLERQLRWILRRTVNFAQCEQVALLVEPGIHTFLNTLGGLRRSLFLDKHRVARPPGVRYTMFVEKYD